MTFQLTRIAVLSTVSNIVVMSEVPAALAVVVVASKIALRHLRIFLLVIII
jgi:hypothetical protein